MHRRRARPPTPASASTSRCGSNRKTSAHELDRMNANSAINRWLTHSPLVAVALYIAAAGSLLAIAGFAVADIIDHQRTLAQASELLAQLQGRRTSTSPLSA